MQSAAGFVKGWLEARDVEVKGGVHNGRPLLAATVGPPPGADHRPARPPRRGARPPRAVRTADRGRPPLRPRRLRHEGRPGGHDVRAARPGRAGSGPRPLRLRGRRGVRGPGAARLGLPGRAGLHRRLRHHRRAHQHAHRHSGQGCTGHADRSHGQGRPRLHAVGGRQRRAQGLRHLPPDRDPALRARVLGHVRPALGQPQPDPGRGRAQQGARRLRDRRRRALPAGPGAGEDQGRGERRFPTPVWSRSSTASRPSSSARIRSCRRWARRSPASRRRPASSCRWGATAPRTRSRSWRRACPPSSAGRWAPATTAPRSGFRSGRWRIIGGRSSSSSTCSPARWARTSGRLRIA